MTTQKIVFYPSTASFTGTSQLNLGPFVVGTVNKLLQARLRGQINSQAESFGSSSVNSNLAMYGIQWGAHGFTPRDVITTAYDTGWLIRQQWGNSDTTTPWSPTTASANVLTSWGLPGWWAGQLAIGEEIDAYFSARAPTGANIANFNMFGSLEMWFV